MFQLNFEYYTRKLRNYIKMSSVS